MQDQPPTRAERIDALRRFADLLDAHPELPPPSSVYLFDPGKEGALVAAVSMLDLGAVLDTSSDYYARLRLADGITLNLSVPIGVMVPKPNPRDVVPYTVDELRAMLVLVPLTDARIDPERLVLLTEACGRMLDRLLDEAGYPCVHDANKALTDAPDDVFHEARRKTFDTFKVPYDMVPLNEWRDTMAERHGPLAAIAPAYLHDALAAKTGAA